MDKPIVFLSHASSDQKLLKRLKESLAKKTGGAVTLFLSSDGQSIPLGRNWVHEIQQALDKSSLMFVFVSPNSLRSSWVHFESGYAYSKNIKVVPVGVRGIDLVQVPAPLSLLQGFNLSSGAALNNLIAIINREFDHGHAESFSDDDFAAMFTLGNTESAMGLGAEISRSINSIRITLDGKGVEDLAVVEKDLADHNIDFDRSKEAISTYGMDISNYPYTFTGKALALSLSSELALINLPIAARIVAEIMKASEESVPIKIDMTTDVIACAGHHNITARLFGSEISLGSDDSHKYGETSFSVGHDVYNGPNFDTIRGSAYVQLKCPIRLIGSIDLTRLLTILFDTGVLLRSE
jgi:hypothetical protein